MNPYNMDLVYSANCNKPSIMALAPGDYLPFKDMPNVNYLTDYYSPSSTNSNAFDETDNNSG